MPNLTEQLKRDGHLLNRPMKEGAKRTRVNPVSARRAQEKAQYAKILPGWKREHPLCEIGPIIKAAGFEVRCLGRTTHPHHIKGRIGKLLCDTRYFLSSCSGDCHPKWVHQLHPAEARALGLLQ